MNDKLTTQILIEILKTLREIAALLKDIRDQLKGGL